MIKRKSNQKANQTSRQLFAIVIFLKRQSIVLETACSLLELVGNLRILQSQSIVFYFLGKKKS